MTEEPVPSVGVILTCHNRMSKTLGCLESLSAQQAAAAVELRVYLTDDGSTDGTAEQVEDRFPDVQIIEGSGALYWSGGMRLAFARAVAADHDHYLWMNDDVVLDPNALGILLSTHDHVSSATGGRAIVVGSLRDPHSGELTYGGVRRTSRVYPLRFGLVQPASVPVPSETMNGNVVLIPRAVAHLVGNIDPAYIQQMGDLDYGLRAGKAGCSVWVAPGTVGACERNPPPVYGTGSIIEESKDVRSPKGLPPSAWRTFVRRWGGPAWPVFYVLPYVRMAALSLRARLGRSVGHLGARRSS